MDLFYQPFADESDGPEDHMDERHEGNNEQQPVTDRAVMARKANVGLTDERIIPWHRQ
jgi:hypothetical protein